MSAALGYLEMSLAVIGALCLFGAAGVIAIVWSVNRERDDEASP